MEQVLLVLHMILAFALIVVVMFQRTAQDGGGLMGGSGGTMGGLFTARGSANLLTRATAILATLFICTSLILGVMASRGHQKTSLADQIGAIAPIEAPKDAAPQEAPSVPVSK